MTGDSLSPARKETIVTRSIVKAFLIAALLASSSRAEITLPELARDESYARTQLKNLAVPGMNAVLDQVQKARGLSPRSDALAVTAAGQRSVLVTELDDAANSNRRLFLFFFPETGESFFLQLQLDPAGSPEMRLWGDGPSELVIAGTQVRLLEQPSSDTFRL